MIVSAISLWKKFNLTTPLCASEWDIEEKNGVRKSCVSFTGHVATDGGVRIFARYLRPLGGGKKPTVLLLPDAGKPLDIELCRYFVEKGYAVLMPDYSGKMPSDTDADFRTVYPPSLDYGNFVNARGLVSMEGLTVEETSWFEWLYVALFSLEYLHSREETGNIGVVGIRTGGDIAWQTLLSIRVKCGVPINSVGWKSFAGLAKFGDDVAHHLSDDTHRYIAAVEAQSYAPYVKRPVLMLCALRDDFFDCDRAYDTYSRLGCEDGSALVYSANSGACIGLHALTDLDLFLEKNLKGREIYIPDTLNISLQEGENNGLSVVVEFDKEGILEEAGVYYAEADIRTKCTQRDWRKLFTIDGKSVKNGKIEYPVKPFPGATAVFVYAYAKYINGFRVMSKIVSKRFPAVSENAVRNRMLFTGKEMDCFAVARYEDYSIGDIFLEKEAAPKMVEGYGQITGAYSIGGLKTYAVASPKNVPAENALLEFDAYMPVTGELFVCVEVGGVSVKTERYVCPVTVCGGGKWKRTILRASDFKGEDSGMPLRSFAEGKALVFEADEKTEFSVTNLLWL